MHIAAAINIRALYAAGHPRVAQAVQAILDDLEAALGGRESVTFFIVGDDLVADDRPLRRSGIYQQNFVQALRRRKVERLTLVRGLDAAQCEQLVSVMAAGGTPASTPNVIVGRVEIAIADGGGRRDRREPVRAPLSAVQVDEGREAFARFRTDRKGSLHKMEEVVWSLMETPGPLRPRRHPPRAPEEPRRVHVRPFRQRLPARAGPGPLLRDPGAHAARDGPRRPCATTWAS